MPELSLNLELLDKINQMRLPFVVVFTKKDLATSEHLARLAKEYPDSLIVSGTKNEGVKNLKIKLQIIAKRFGIEEARVGIVGYPNLGKSALINALVHRSRTEVSSKPGTTRGVQWVKCGDLRILDSPGVIPFEDKNNRLVLIGSKSPDKLRVPDKSAQEIIKMFLIENPEKLKEFYGIEIKSRDPYEVMLEIGEKRRFLKRKAEIDEDRTARTIIREWQGGKLRL